MAVAVDPDRVYEYVLKADRHLADGTPNPKPTVWKFRTLRSKVRSRIEDQLASASTGPDGKVTGVHVHSGSAALAYLKEGLLGVENFFDENGNEIAFETEPNGKGKGANRFLPTDDFLDRIHEDDQAELSKAIQLGNKLTEDERKN
jgi:hypothetical protein